MKVCSRALPGSSAARCQDELRHGDGAYQVHLLGRATATSRRRASPRRRSPRRGPTGRPRGRPDRRRALRRGARARAALERARNDVGRPSGRPTARVSLPLDLGRLRLRRSRPTSDPAGARELLRADEAVGRAGRRAHAPEGLAILGSPTRTGPASTRPGEGRGADDAAGRPTRASRSRSSAARRACSAGSATSSARSGWCWSPASEGAFNIGADGEAVALADVARLACELTGAPQELIEEVEPPPGRVMTRISTERVRALGWRPRSRSTRACACCSNRCGRAPA